MKKNVAGQKVGAQILNMDGTAFTSVVTVYVCGDAGTQAIGATASGSCTLEGNGFYTYGPNQSETNYDHIAFTFIGTSSIPVTVQVYTNFPQTGDSFARIGTPAGSDLATDVAAVKADTSTNFTRTSTILTNVSVLVTNVSAILTDTGTTLDGVLASVNSYVVNIKADTSTNLTYSSTILTNTSTIVTVTSAILTDTAEIGAAGAGLTNINLPNQTMDIVGNITGNLSGSVGSVTGGATSAEVAAVKADTAAILTDTGTTLDAMLSSVKAKTDQLTFGLANAVDCNIKGGLDVAWQEGGVGNKDIGPAA